jgi:hypothetical protein
MASMKIEQLAILPEAYSTQSGARIMATFNLRSDQTVVACGTAERWAAERAGQRHQP